MIDHGNGISTVYMHNSQLVVGVGQTVEQGQVIAKAGSKVLLTTLQHRRGLLTELAAKTFYNIDIGRNQEDICKYPCERTAECYKDITEFWYQDRYNKNRT